MLKMGAACAFLPTAATYVRTWKPTHGLFVPDFELIPFSQLKVMLYRPQFGLHDYLLSQHYLKPVRLFVNISNARILAATPEDLAKIFQV